MAIKFTTTGDAGKQHGVKILTYGRAGAGKTTLCATAPSPLIISAESGLLSLAGHNIPVIEILSIGDLVEAYDWCSKSAEAKQFETFCLDSISEIGEVVLANAKAQVKDPRQAYGELIDKMTVTLKSFRDIRGHHVYMAAKLEPNKDEHTGIVRYGPSMPGSKLGQQLPYLYDEVFHLGIGQTDKGEKYRYLQTTPDLQYEAKDRSGKLSPLEQPNLQHIITKILGE